MLKPKFGYAPEFVRAAMAVVLFLAVGGFLLAGCNSGDTAGGDAAEENQQATGSQFVSDGGAGASLTIGAPDSLATGSTTGFSVTALDPRGEPLTFMRLRCDSEQGIAILEPSADGVAFESTSDRGLMSGVIGCNTPGSFIMQCKGPDESGLIAEHHLVCRGSVPDGFDGFPGAAGGNLGGGLLIDETPDTDDSNGLRISLVQFVDAGFGGTVGTPGSGFGIIDTVFNPDCDGDPATTDDEEPFTDTRYYIQITNPTLERVFISGVTLVTAGAITQTQSVTAEVAPASGSTPSTAEISGIYLAFTSAGGQIYAGDGTSVAGTAGTFVVTVTLTGTDESGTAITLTDSISLTFGSVDNCDE